MRCFCVRVSRFLADFDSSIFSDWRGRMGLKLRFHPLSQQVNTPALYCIKEVNIMQTILSFMDVAVSQLKNANAC